MFVEFCRVNAMVRILTQRSRAKIPLARADEPDMPPKRTKKIPVGVYRTQIRPNIRPYRVSDLISQDIKTVDRASDWLIGNLRLVKDG